MVFLRLTGQDTALPTLAASFGSQMDVSAAGATGPESRVYCPETPDARYRNGANLPTTTGIISGIGGYIGRQLTTNWGIYYR